MSVLALRKPVEKKVSVTGVYDQLAQTIKSIVVCVGGAGSSKSYSLAQLMIWKLANEEGKVLGIGRKTFPALRMTAYLLVVSLLKEYGIYPHCEHNKTEHSIDFRSNRLQFFSLDDPDKIKSFNANVIWLEEANEFTFEDYTIINLRLNRDPGQDRNQLYLSFNPVDSWIFDKLEKSPDAEWIESNYKDNPFLSPAYIVSLEGLKDQDLNYYNIYTLGQRGFLENIIYPSWDLIDDMPFDAQYEKNGIDFGFENPSVIVRVMVTGKDLYADELLYKTHLTNAELIEIGKTLKWRDAYADSAEPQRIEEIRRAGLSCMPAIKDVQLGIDVVKRYNIHITKRSANLIKEIRSYQRKKDKTGKVLDEPIKFNDHALDALRYAMSGLLTSRKYAFEV